MIRTLYITINLFLICLSANAQTWLPATPPPSFLTDHTFGFAIDGKGYLVAGTTEFDGPTNTFLQYDPLTDEWTTLDTFPGGGRGYSIGDVWDGKAYFGFGTTTESLLNDLWVFDPDSMKWTALDTCPCNPRLHPAFVAHNGKIFAGLGNGEGGNFTDWWEYDIATNEWSQKPDFPDLPRHHPYQFAVGDYVYTGFGHGAGIYNDWYRYDPENEVWDKMADLPAEGRVAGTQFSYGEKGYVLSGDGDDHLSMEEGEFWEYDPAFNEWTQLPSHPGKSRWAPASFIIDGVVYLFNGTTYFNTLGYVYQTEAYKFNLNPKNVYPDFERVVSHQYNAKIYDVAPMSNGRWALAVRELPQPHALWDETLSMIILDSLGSIQRRTIIEPVVQNEVTEMGPLFVLPNDEVLLRYDAGNCDACCHLHALEKFDTSGQSVWHLTFSDWHVPHIRFIAPDSNIIIHVVDTLSKLSWRAGETLWEFKDNFVNPYSLLFVPGTEDIIVGDNTGLKYFRQVIIGDSVTYELLNSQEMDLGSGYLNLLGVDSLNVFYAMNTESKEIFRFRSDLQPTFVMLLPGTSLNQISFTEDKFALGFGFSNMRVSIYDTLGQRVDTLNLDVPGLKISEISYSSNGLALAGAYQSGPTSPDYPDDVYQQGREEGWFRFISNSDEDDSTQVLSLSVTDVMEIELPQIDSFFSPGPDPGWLFNIEGGRFLIQVTNTGNMPVENFSINTIFNFRINYFFCSPVSANHVDVAGAVIEPGESVWIEFNDLLALDQKEVPPQFCFWTSGNNDRPDEIPDDDLYCVDNLVSSSSPQLISLQVYPNPADEEIEIIFSTEFSASKWSLIDAYGRILKKGENFYDNRIKVSELSDGIYFLVGELFSEKIIVNH